MLPPEAIQEFKELYRKHFGEELTDQEAEQKAEKFLDLYRAVYRHADSACTIGREVPPPIRNYKAPNLVTFVIQR